MRVRASLRWCKTECLAVTAKSRQLGGRPSRVVSLPHVVPPLPQSASCECLSSCEYTPRPLSSPSAPHLSPLASSSRPLGLALFGRLALLPPSTSRLSPSPSGTPTSPAHRSSTLLDTLARSKPRQEPCRRPLLRQRSVDFLPARRPHPTSLGLLCAAVQRGRASVTDACACQHPRRRPR